MGNHEIARPAANEVLLITSGDLRQSANQVCWPAQRDMEEKLTAAFAQKGYQAGPRPCVRRNSEARLHLLAAHGHGRLHEDSSRGAAGVCHRGLAVQPSCASRPAQPPGPILTVANWSGQWPGLVGLLNLNGSLDQGRQAVFVHLEQGLYRRLIFKNALDEWLRTGKITHDLSHVHALDKSKLPAESAQLGAQLAADLKHRKAIMGIFDEGCMGMYNAIIDDELLNPAGIFKERLSQSALVAKMRTVSDAEAQGRLRRGWLRRASSSPSARIRRRSSRSIRSSASARCTSPPSASRMSSAATPSAFNISRG